MNKVNLVGRLGKDPEISTSSNGKTFVKFSLATNDGYGDNKKTNWHSCTAFGKVAEIIEKHVKKGNELAVSGSIDYNKYEDKYFTGILVNDITFIGGKLDNGNQSESNNQPSTNLSNEDEDDNLPF